MVVLKVYFIMYRVFSERKYTDNKGATKDVQLIVVSLSPQPTLSLAARYKLSPEEATKKLAGKLAACCKQSCIIHV